MWPWVPQVSLIVANLYMEYLEQKALSTAPHPLDSGAGMWMTPLSSTKEVNKQGFLQNINSVDPAIKFTVEDNKEDGSIPFLDTILKPEENGRSIHYCVQEAYSYRPVLTVG